MMMQDIYDMVQNPQPQAPPGQLPPGAPPPGLLAQLMQLGSVDQRHKLLQGQFDQAGQTAAGAPVDYSKGRGGPLALAGIANLVSAGVGGYQQGKATGGLRDLVTEQDAGRTAAAQGRQTLPMSDLASVLTASPADAPAKFQASQDAIEQRSRYGDLMSMTGDPQLAGVGKSLAGEAGRDRETMLGMPQARQQLAGGDIRNQEAQTDLAAKLRGASVANSPVVAGAGATLLRKLGMEPPAGANPAEIAAMLSPAEKVYEAESKRNAVAKTAVNPATGAIYDVRTGKPVSGGAGGGSAALLTPEALDQAADMFNTTGQLPSVGQGAAGAAVRRQIVNRSAELHAGANLAGNKANYKADSGSLVSQQKILDNAESWERTGKANLNVLLSVAQKLKDTGSPWLNSPVRAFMEKGAGDPNQTAFKAAHATVVNEYAKILSGAQGSGSVTEGARHEAESMLPLDSTFEQMAAAAKILDTDAGNRIGSARQQVATIRGRTTGQPAATEAPAAAPKATHRFNPATGKIEAVP